MVAAVLLLAGCGGSERAATATVIPPASTAEPTTVLPATSAAPTTPTPPPTAGTIETEATAPPPNPGGASTDEAQPGGAGDEEPIRQPATFTLGAAGLRPVSVSVAPFLAVALTVVNPGAEEHAVRLIGTPTAFAVPAGGRVTRRLAGLRAGTYTLAVDGGKDAASLVVGADVGP